MKIIIIKLAIFCSLFAYADRPKKGVLISIQLSPVGSFEITSKRIKGGKITKTGSNFYVENMYIPVKTLTSGMDLRDEHLRQRLSGEKVEVLKATGSAGSGKGTILIRETEKEFEFTYKVISPKYLKANFSLNLKDFKILDINYMGVGVKNIVDISVIAPYKTK